VRGCGTTVDDASERINLFGIGLDAIVCGVMGDLFDSNAGIVGRFGTANEGLGMHARESVAQF
jgi:hypothetical protein